MFKSNSGFTVASFIDKNYRKNRSLLESNTRCPSPRYRKTTLDTRKEIFQYLNLPLQGLYIVNDFVKHHCLPSYLQIDKNHLIVMMNRTSSFQVNIIVV